MTAVARPSSRRETAQRRQTWHRSRGPLLGTVGGEHLGFHVAGRFRSRSAPRGLVALASASGLRGETGAEHALRWARRNWDQLGPIRRGAGPRPETRNAVATVVAETL